MTSDTSFQPLTPSSSTSVRLKQPPKTVHGRWLPSLHELTPQEQGYARGYSEGWKKAAADCQVEMEAKVKASRGSWDGIAKALNSIPHEMIQKLREQLITLSFNAVRKLLAATPITREEVIAQVQQMLEHAESGSEITVQLNPADLELLTAEDQGALWNEDFTHLKWTPSPSVARGGCVLRGEFGWVDGRRESRVKKLEQVATQAGKDPTAT
jgi:flagellar biosynthesis/type III secretory pathway protein FliH